MDVDRGHVTSQLPRRQAGLERCELRVDAQVVSAACKTLASLAARAETAAESLTASAQNYLAALRQSGSSHSAYCSRQVAPFLMALAE